MWRLFDEKNEGLFEKWKRFEVPAAKGSREALWVLEVVKSTNRHREDLITAFSDANDALGWFIAGKLFLPSSTNEQQRFELFQKSAKGGCTWGQVVLAHYYRTGSFVTPNQEEYESLLSKAASGGNPWAQSSLGEWFLSEEGGKQTERGLFYLKQAAEQDFPESHRVIAIFYRDSWPRDLVQSAYYAAQSYSYATWNRLLKQAMLDEASGEKLAYTLGWGMFWYMYKSPTPKFIRQTVAMMDFGEKCMDFYLENVIVQQESIVLFLLHWNAVTGVKEPGKMIARMVQRESCDQGPLKWNQQGETKKCVVN
jgi:hypothetical protein